MRYKQLDSLRGLAACSVLVCHFLYSFPSFQQPSKLLTAIKKTPFNILWGGHEAVILFFVLSGFVLSIPFFSTDVKPLIFLVKRICRIYFPYAFAVILSFACFSYLSPIQKVAGLTNWFNKEWTIPLTINEITNHVLLIGQFSSKFDPPIWSLIQEMRISLVLPFLMFFVKRLKWNFILALSLVTSWIGFKILSKLAIDIYSGNFLVSMHFFLFFVIGILLSKYRASLHEHFEVLGFKSKIIVVGIGLLAYNYSVLIPVDSELPHDWFFNDWIISLGASIFIIGSFTFNRLLLSPVLLFLGKISYSIYLIHGVVLLVIMRLTYPIVTNWLIFIIYSTTTFVIATLSYYLVEKPSIRLGRYFERVILDSHWFSKPLIFKGFENRKSA